MRFQHPHPRAECDRKIRYAASIQSIYPTGWRIEKEMMCWTSRLAKGNGDDGGAAGDLAQSGRDVEALPARPFAPEARRDKITWN